MTSTSAVSRPASGGRASTGPASASQNPWTVRCIGRPPYRRATIGGVSAPTAVILDLDGVIVDTEEVWDRERRAYAAAHGGTWNDAATRLMQGKSSAEWSRHMHDELRVDRDP